MSTSLRLGVAEFRARPGRALLPGVALVVGVACLLAALVLSDALTRSVDEGAPLTPSSVSHVVDTKPVEYDAGATEANRPTLDDALLAKLSSVGRAVPVQIAQADLLDGNGRAGSTAPRCTCSSPTWCAGRWPRGRPLPPTARSPSTRSPLTSAASSPATGSSSPPRTAGRSR